jgi:hypothetical protein
MALSNRQVRNTEATIRVAHKLLQDRWATVIADARKESPSSTVKFMAQNDVERAQIIWIKTRLMEAFPQSYAEVNNPVNLSYLIGPDRKFKPHFVKYQSALAGKTPGPGESSACLLLALKTLKADTFTAVEDQLNYAVAYPEPDKVPEFVDGFGKPWTFIRFGQGVSVQAANPATSAKGQKFCDPVDSGGLLITPNWYPSVLRGPPGAMPPNSNSFEARIHAVSPDNGVTAFYTIPVIQSAGRDNALGTADDIFSFNLKGD